jgi:predicted transcriptional regulator
MSVMASSPLSIRLPDSIRRRVEELAEREGISVEQFIASATGEKLAVWLSLDHLREEAARGRREDLERLLTAVPDKEPEASDRIHDPNESA